MNELAWWQYLILPLYPILFLGMVMLGGLGALWMHITGGSVF